MSNIVSVSSNPTNVTVDTDTLNISVTTGDVSIAIATEGVQGPSGVDGSVSKTDMQVLGVASKAGGAFTYQSGALDIITYVDNEGITSHTKQLNYTSGKLTQTVEVFTYETKVWTVTIDFTYSGSTLISKTNPIIVKV